MKAHRHIPGEMNKLEARYAAHLDSLKLAGEIASWRFEFAKFRLATATFYTPDFWIVLKDDTVELHEVKGFWQDDARVKIKVAAEMLHEFVFRAVTWSKKEGWQYETFGGRG